MGDNYDEHYFKNEFDLMVKNLEVYNSFNPLMDTNVMMGTKDRPRPIMSPNPSLCGVITWMQQIAFSTFKNHYPEFVHAENSSSFWGRTLPSIQTLKQPKCYSLDGGSHDSHQHHWLIQAVDFQIWKKLKSNVLTFLERYGAKNPPKLLESIYSILLNPIAKINLKKLQWKELRLCKN